jgi:hypothetical protein
VNTRATAEGGITLRSSAQDPPGHDGHGIDLRRVHLARACEGVEEDQKGHDDGGDAILLSVPIPNHMMNSGARAILGRR